MKVNEVIVTAVKEVKESLKSWVGLSLLQNVMDGIVTHMNFPLYT